MTSQGTGIRKRRWSGNRAWCRQLTFVGLGALVFFALAMTRNVSGGGTARPPQSYERLTFDQSVRREIAALETHQYALDLVQGRPLLIAVYGEGLPVAVILHDEQADAALAVDRLASVPDRGLLAVSAERTGTYRVIIVARGKRGRTGRYELRVGVVSNPDAEFRTREHLQKLRGEMWRAYAAGTKEASRAVVEKGQAALALMPAVGPSYFDWEVPYLIGDRLRSLGDYPQALAYLRQSLQAAAELKLSVRQAETLTTIGQVYYSLGDYQNSLAAYQSALPLWEGDAHADTPINLMGWTLASIGDIYNLLGEHGRALEYFRQSTARYEEYHRPAGPNAFGHEFHRGMVLVNNGLGTAYAKLGDKQRALDAFSEMLKHVKQTDWWQAEAEALSQIADLYVSLGELQSARAQYEAALRVARAAGRRATEADVLVSLGNFYRLTGEAAAAQEHLRPALEIYGAIGAKRGQALALTHLGTLALARGEPRAALAACRAALPWWEQVGDRYGEGLALNGLGGAYAALDDRLAALQFFTRALELRRSTGDREGEANTLYHLARLTRAAGELASARTHIEAALELTEAVRASVLGQELRASYLGATRDYYEFYTELLMQMHQRQPSAGFEAAALRASELARARLLRELLAEARADIRQGAPAELIARERELQQRINAAAEYQFRLESKPHSSEQRAGVARELQTLTQELQAVQAHIRTTSPRYAALTQPRPLGAREIQRLLDSRTVLLEYALGAERSYLWAVTPSALHTYELPPRAEIEGLARRVYELLTTRNRERADEGVEERRVRLARADAEWLTAARELSRMLLAPAATEISGKRLLIVAQGALQYIPFNALPAPVARLGRVTAARASRTASRHAPAYRPLIAEHEVVVLPSASLLASLNTEAPLRQGEAKTIAILADPVFSATDERVRDRPGEPAKGQPSAQSTTATAPLLRALRDVKAARFAGLRLATGLPADDELVTEIPRLYATRQEADKISALLPAYRQRRALDFEASRATATSPELGQYQILHFATHALIDNLHPELSGVVLSLVDAQGRAQDGFLRAHEIYNLKLSADLVVLSGCQTGLGKEIKGEGVIGLTHSFMYAGAARVVISLWALDDTATADLMAAFYQNLLGSKQLSPAAALRAAQLKAWRSGRWPSPYYWAGFILQGDWR